MSIYNNSISNLHTIWGPKQNLLTWTLHPLLWQETISQPSKWLLKSRLSQVPKKSLSFKNFRNFSWVLERRKKTLVGIVRWFNSSSMCNLVTQCRFWIKFHRWGEGFWKLLVAAVFHHWVGKGSPYIEIPSLTPSTVDIKTPLASFGSFLLLTVCCLRTFFY